MTAAVRPGIGQFGGDQSGVGRLPVPVRRRLTVGLVVPAAAVAAALAVWQPLLAIAALVAGAVLVAMVQRLDRAVLVYVAAEPFGDYLTDLSGPAVKLVGALLFAAWLVRLVADERPLALDHPVVVAAGVLFVVLLASLALHPNDSTGLVTTARYLSYLTVLVVLVDAMRSGLAPRRVVRAFVVSCTAAACFGLVVFLGTGGGRAAGPMLDANDFAFYLICAVPFALLLWHAGGPRRHLYAVAAVLLVVTTLTTFSRGALLGLGAMAAVAVVLGLVRAKAVLTGAVLLVVAVSALVLAAPDLVENSLAEKQHVASENVSARFTTWTIAAEMTMDEPVLGHGPGGFATHAPGYASGRFADTSHVEVVHMMYLDVASELGLLGLGAFLAMLGAGAAGAVRGRRSGPDPHLATAVCVALVGILTAATFLSEQYYLPVWLLVALGAALDSRRPGAA